MPLLDLWKSSPDQLKDKQVQQLIAFAGGGRLLDDSPCSTEFRSFLGSVSSASLLTYADQCLEQSFQDSGLALQDIVNEIGARLGAHITNGRYRGTVKHTGFDGLWVFPNGHAIVAEVKTTDTYRIDLNTIANYRRALINKEVVEEAKSSMLLVVGRQDTGDLEAQIRGSRHAWDIRIISVDALARLASIKEEVEDPSIVQRIHNILIPHEFTRLDAIADILFSAAEDIRQEDSSGSSIEETKSIPLVKDGRKFIPVAFQEACVQRVQSNLGMSFVRQSRTGYVSADKLVALSCSASKEHNPDTSPNYWFAFHPHQRAFLKEHSQSYVALGCGSSERLLLIPFTEFETWLDGMGTTANDTRMYWHITIFRKGNSYILRRSKGEEPIDLTRFVLPT
ncbi:MULTISPECIES: hypothetical protein [unclassified Variovorax]|uniref:hypothetical protein n=1 Tax=unclassified Variovorax TaxID=663243 RepID=UPI0034E980DB